MIWIFIAVAALNFAAFYLDYSITVRGIRKGVADESNWWVVKLYGPAPTSKQLLIGLLPQDLGIFALALTLSLMSEYAPIIGAGILTGNLVRHVQNYFEWKRYGA